MRFLVLTVVVVVACAPDKNLPVGAACGSTNDCAMGDCFGGECFGGYCTGETDPMCPAPDHVCVHHDGGLFNDPYWSCEKICTGDDGCPALTYCTAFNSMFCTFSGMRIVAMPDPPVVNQPVTFSIEIVDGRGVGTKKDASWSFYYANGDNGTGALGLTTTQMFPHITDVRVGVSVQFDPSAVRNHEQTFSIVAGLH